MSARETHPDPTADLGVVYQCPYCESRYLNQRRCPDCLLCCRPVDRGGHCPYCDEPVTLADLAQPTGPAHHDPEVTALTQ